LHALDAVRGESHDEHGWTLRVDLSQADAARLARLPGGAALPPLLPEAAAATLQTSRPAARGTPRALAAPPARPWPATAPPRARRTGGTARGAPIQTGAGMAWNIPGKNNDNRPGNQGGRNPWPPRRRRGSNGLGDIGDRLRGIFDG